MSLPILRHTLINVSMYVDILSSALDDWVSGLAGYELIEYALMCRDELRAVWPLGGGSAYTALAAEIAYDRALIALCTERGIDAHATSFAYPREERRRIEMVLKQSGLDLDSPRRYETRAQVSSGVEADPSADPPRKGVTAAEQRAATAFVEASGVPMAEATDHEG
jgi:hypothetical protein